LQKPESKLEIPTLQQDKSLSIGFGPATHLITT